MFEQAMLSLTAAGQNRRGALIRAQASASFRRPGMPVCAVSNSGLVPQVGLGTASRSCALAGAAGAVRFARRSRSPVALQHKSRYPGSHLDAVGFPCAGRPETAYFRRTFGVLSAY
jgi:hypothetical protein